MIRMNGLMEQKFHAVVAMCFGNKEAVMLSYVVHCQFGEQFVLRYTSYREHNNVLIKMLV